MKRKGISILSSYIALTMIVTTIGGILFYFLIYQTKVTNIVVTSEIEKEEIKLLEKISLIYWGKDCCILSNDGEIKVTIKKIYIDNNIIDKSNNPIIINPHEKKEISIPYGKNLMIETSSGNLIKLIEKGFIIVGTTWTESLPIEITITSYVTITITMNTTTTT